MKIKYYTKVDTIPKLSDKKKVALKAVSKKYTFRTNSYYNSLIDWDDKNDPLRRIVIPDEDELINWGTLDSSNEVNYQPVEALEHKYSSTALLLCNDVCGAYCRFCFRKRLFQEDNDEVQRDLSKAIAYIKNHKEINNVLLTGGDPLMMSNGRISSILNKLKDISHVKIIRIGTKMLAFNPFCIIENDELVDFFAAYSNFKKVYFMLHFNHPREITEEAILAIRKVQNAGIATINQTPIIKGVNDNEGLLSELLNTLSFLGVFPYYIFCCRPTAGNYTYAIPIEEGYRIFRNAVKNNSGLAKTPKFIMSHEKGKIEVVGLFDGKIMMRKHNWANEKENQEMMQYPSNPHAYWFEDYVASEVLDAGSS